MRPTIGVVFRPASPPEELRGVVEAAERSGVHELWLWEDCFFEGGLTSATAALAWSTRLRVGIGLLPVPLRNPALSAMEIATVERLFPGRFVPGLGHGVLPWMRQVGAGVESPMTLLCEYVTAVRDLLAGEQVDAAGRYVRLDQVQLDWPPARPPELVVGARGPKTIGLAGELADGVILDTVTDPSVITAGRAALDAARTAAGRPGRARVIAFTPADTRVQSAEEIADWTGTLAEAGADSVVLQGPDDAPDAHALIAAVGPLLG